MRALQAKTMNPVLLNNIPESGSIDEVRFDAAGDCTWVKFQDSEYIDWVGVFGMGWGGGEAAIQINDDLAFVLSNGQGYLVDINGRELLSKTDCDYLKSVIPSDCGNAFIGATDTEVYVYSLDGLVFSTERIASDGIKLASCSKGLVIGEVWGFDKWYPFALDVSNQKFTCAWSCTW